ncbi:MAG: cysteine-rich CWC family protein [Schlesneria sp.]
MQIPECETPKESTGKCPSCMGPFICDLANGCASCWCMSLPAVLPVNQDATCLCRECLEKAIASRSGGFQPPGTAG